MMIEPADIRRLLDAFEHSDWDEIRLSVDGTEILISASDTAIALPPSAQAGVATTPAAAPALPLATPAPRADERAAPAPVAEQPQEIPPGVAVRSPSPGIFWRSPAPGEPPFVEVGQRVQPESMVCIVEVMKLMNRVVAGVSGTVAAIPVENSQQVARDQVLVVITPDGAGEA